MYKSIVLGFYIMVTSAELSLVAEGAKEENEKEEEVLVVVVLNR